MLKIGLTGGIGSGKSTVAKIFATFDIPVYYADDAAKKLMNESIQIRAKIKERFGEAAYIDEMLNRPYLAEMVFNDASKIEALNAIVHPATLAHAAEWMQLQSSPYAIKEAALIFESGSQQQLDYVIGVSAPAELRIKRVMQRDSSTREAILNRMSKQIDEEIKMKLCDFVILNDEKNLLIPQVILLHEKLVARIRN